MSSTVDRAIEILEFCSEGQRSVQDIADHLGTHRTTASRLVQTLANRSLLVKGLDGRYSVGVRTAGLAQHAIEQSDLRSVAHQHLVAW
jgi:DNA-binding IclR family transcriptional regulator